MTTFKGSCALLTLIIVSACGGGAGESAVSAIDPSLENTGSPSEIIDSENPELQAAQAEIVEENLPSAPVSNTDLQVDTELQEEVAPEEVAPEEVAPEEVAPEEVAPEEVAPETPLPKSSKIGAPEDFGPFNDFALKAIDAYEGLDSEHELNLQTVGPFLYSAVVGVPVDASSLETDIEDPMSWVAFPWAELFQSRDLDLTTSSLRAIPNDGSNCCDPGANNQVSGKHYISELGNGSENRLIKITYGGCVYANKDFENFNVTGDMQVSFNRNINTGKKSTLYIAFDKVTIESDDQIFEITGALKWPEPGVCDQAGARTLYLNAKNLNSGKSVFLENITLAKMGGNAGQCDNASYHPNHITGRVLLSDHGAVSFSTSKATQLPIFHAGVSTYNDIPEDYGDVILTGANSTSSFSWGFHDLDRALDQGYDPINNSVIIEADLTLTNDQYPETLTISHNAITFNQGSFLDLGDSDGDGMSNSWEVVSGLDPLDLQDHMSDNDGDGRIALFEYEGIGVADDSEITGDLFDRKITLSSTTPLGSSESLEVDVYSPIENGVYRDEQHSVVITANKEGEWEYSEDICVLSAEDNALTCQMGSLGSYQAYFSPSEDGSIEFHASTDIPEKDFDATNNSVTLDVEFVRIRNDLSISSLDNVDVYVDEVETLKLDVRQIIGLHSVDATLTISVPTELQILSAKRINYYSNNSNECDVSSVVTCIATNFESPKVFSVELQYIATTSGSFNIDWELAPVEYEDILFNNRMTTNVQAMRSTAPLQAMIDGSLPGDVISIPPGDYVGELSLDGMNLTLEGATGDTPTVFHTIGLYDKAIVGLGDQAVVRNLHFKSRGYPIDFSSGNYLTVEDSVFEPLPMSMSPPGASTYTRDLIKRSADGGRRDLSLQFVNNVVKGYGVFENSICGNLLDVMGWSSISVQGNTFHNLDCDRGMFAGEQYWYGSDSISESVYIGNNTFDSIGIFMSQSFFTPPQNHSTLIENNIFHSIDQIFESATYRSYRDSGNVITTSNNIVFGSERTSVLSARMLADGTGETVLPDLDVDPLLMDRSAKDYRLSAVSPAIDTGVEPMLSSNEFDYVPSFTYVDGLLDGSIESDIGAVEFIP